MSDEKSPIDTEALQAQIDLSLSLTFDLVSSWMNENGSKPSSVQNTVLSKQDDEEYQNELENLLQRPPTLV